MKATLNWIRVNPISRAHVNTTPTGNERSLERVRTDSKLCHEVFFREVFDNFLLYNFYLVNVKLGILLRCRAWLLTSWIRERDFERDAQRVFFDIFEVSDESLGRNQTPRTTNHEVFFHFEVFDNALWKKFCLFLSKLSTKALKEKSPWPVGELSAQKRIQTNTFLWHRQKCVKIRTS